jgi:hypothetical protein
MLGHDLGRDESPPLRTLEGNRRNNLWGTQSARAR